LRFIPLRLVFQFLLLSFFNFFAPQSPVRCCFIPAFLLSPFFIFFSAQWLVLFRSFLSPLPIPFRVVLRFLMCSFIVFFSLQSSFSFRFMLQFLFTSAPLPVRSIIQFCLFASLFNPLLCSFFSVGSSLSILSSVSSLLILQFLLFSFVAFFSMANSFVAFFRSFSLHSSISGLLILFTFFSSIFSSFSLRSAFLAQSELPLSSDEKGTTRRPVLRPSRHLHPLLSDSAFAPPINGATSTSGRPAQELAEALQANETNWQCLGRDARIHDSK
jgi:hypothetical protein